MNIKNMIQTYLNLTACQGLHRYWFNLIVMSRTNDFKWLMQYLPTTMHNISRTPTYIYSIIAETLDVVQQTRVLPRYMMPKPILSWDKCRYIDYTHHLTFDYHERQENKTENGPQYISCWCRHDAAPSPLKLNTTWYYEARKMRRPPRCFQRTPELGCVAYYSLLLTYILTNHFAYISLWILGINICRAAHESWTIRTVWWAGCI